jgi:hypothetical protein
MFPQVPASSNVRKPAANMLKSSLLQFLLCNFALLLLLLPGSVNGVRGKHLCAICVEYHDGPAPKNMEQFCALHCRLQQQPQPPPQFANVLTSSGDFLFYFVKLLVQLDYAISFCSQMIQTALNLV